MQETLHILKEVLLMNKKKNSNNTKTKKDKYCPLILNYPQFDGYDLHLRGSMEVEL